MNDIRETVVASRAVRLIDSMWTKIRCLEADLEQAREDLSLANKRIAELENPIAARQSNT